MSLRELQMLDSEIRIEELARLASFALKAI